MTQLTELNDISIAQICFYVPSLAVAILLASRHGFGRNAGWLYLILFSVTRILGASLELATISQPRNISLFIGASTLQNIGLSPLILIMIGLVGRVLASVSHNRAPFLQPRMLRVVQLLVMIGLILGIVGGNELGTKLGNAYAGGPEAIAAAYSVPTESRAGLALMIAGYGLLVVATVVLGAQVRSADPGEKRLLLAVAVGLPFVLVRLVFAALGTYDASNADFRSFMGGPSYPTYLLAMAVIMEMIAVAIFEVVGLTLHRVPRAQKTTADAVEAVPMGGYRQQQGVGPA